MSNQCVQLTRLRAAPLRPGVGCMDVASQKRGGPQENSQGWKRSMLFAEGLDSTAIY